MAVTIDRDHSGADDPVNRGLLDRYRQSSAELDECPAASARASILAAAAREVGARPVDAAAKPRARTRWPLAAAAAVMLSTLAVMLAIRTNEEMPQFGAPPETARSAADNAVPPAKTAPALPTVEPPPSDREAIGRQITEKREVQTRNERSAQRAKSETGSIAPAHRETDRPAPANSKKDSIAQEPREADRRTFAEGAATSPTDELQKARQNAPAASPASPPAPEPTSRPKLRAESSEAGRVAQIPPTDQAGADARRDAAQPAARAPLASAQSERKQADESAAAWLERIIKLRREGRHDEADAELKRFRERYPQVQPPAQALAPTGTR